MTFLKIEVGGLLITWVGLGIFPRELKDRSIRYKPDFLLSIIGSIAGNLHSPRPAVEITKVANS